MQFSKQSIEQHKERVEEYLLDGDEKITQILLVIRIWWTGVMEGAWKVII